MGLYSGCRSGARTALLSAGWGLRISCKLGRGGGRKTNSPTCKLSRRAPRGVRAKPLSASRGRVSARSALRVAVIPQRRWPVIRIEAETEIFAELIRAKWHKQGPEYQLFACAPCERGAGVERDILRTSLTRDVVREAIDLCAVSAAAGRKVHCRSV